jgi:hypothetical protein
MEEEEKNQIKEDGNASDDQKAPKKTGDDG